MKGTVHVVGAGLAGLSAAVWSAKAGRPVDVYEAAGQAGGRCRSYFDETLGRRIDNGNHLVLSGNTAVHEFLGAIGSKDSLCGPVRAEFEFVDVRNGERWTLRPGAGRIPWWIFRKDRRVPGSRPLEYARALRLAWAGRDETVTGCLGGPGVLFERFWEPLAVAALNTDADEAAASLLWPVVRETFGRGEAACRPRIARVGLGDSFVDPSLRALARHSAGVHFGRRFRGLDVEGDSSNDLAVHRRRQGRTEQGGLGHSRGAGHGGRKGRSGDRGAPRQPRDCQRPLPASPTGGTPQNCRNGRWAVSLVVHPR